MKKNRPWIFYSAVFCIQQYLRSKIRSTQSTYSLLKEREKASLRLKSKLKAYPDDQTRQVKDLFLKRASADKTNRELMKQQREQTDKELATILTQDQMTAYLKMKDERRANMMQHRRKRVPLLLQPTQSLQIPAEMIKKESLLVEKGVRTDSLFSD